MKFNVEKLKQMSRPMTDEEKKDIEFRKENREWLAVSERLALKLRRILRTEGILQSELAERMGVTPAQVTKILSGKENLGLKTISKIENAIGHSLIEVTMEDNHPVVDCLPPIHHEPICRGCHCRYHSKKTFRPLFIHCRTYNVLLICTKRYYTSSSTWISSSLPHLLRTIWTMDKTLKSQTNSGSLMILRRM